MLLGVGMQSTKLDESKHCTSCCAADVSVACLPLLCCPQALVDAPGQARRVVNFKRLTLTDFVIEIPRLAKKSVLTAKFQEAGE